MFLLSSEVGNLFEQLTFWIAKLAYTLIGSMYKLFFSLANAQLFNNELISSFTNRIYYIIGVVMLFVFVYIILTNIINPDGGKGKNSPISVIKNVVIALAIIVFTPTMFELAYSVQSSVFENNVIGRLVLGSSSSDTQTYDSANGFVSTLLNSSFSVDSDAPEGALIDLENAEYLLSYDGDFSGYEELINSSNDYISYNGLISLIVACFCGYVLLGYLLDVALRAFKLGFLQVIAPIPAVMSIVPNQSKILSSWVKESLKTFFEVFLKIAALMFVVFMIGQVNNNLGDIFGNNGFFFNAFVIIGLFSFIKVLPKLLSQIFGFSDSSGIFNTKAKISSFKDNIKETFAPLTNFSSRAIGTVGGAVSAYNYHKKALKATNRDSSKLQALTSLYTGATRGAKYGMKFGKVTNDQLLHEKLWSNEDYQQKSTMQKVGATFENSIRDNFGFKYKINEDLDIGDLVLTERNSEDKRNIEIIKNSLEKSVKAIKDEFNPIIKRNEMAQNIVNAKYKLIDDLVNDENSKITQSVRIPLIKQTIDSNGNVIKRVSDSSFTSLNNYEIKQQLKKLKDPTSEIYSLISENQRRKAIDDLEEAMEINNGAAMHDQKIAAKLSQYNNQLSNLYSSAPDLGFDIAGNDSFNSKLLDYLNNPDDHKKLKDLRKAISNDATKLTMDTKLASVSESVSLVVDGVNVQKTINGLTFDPEIQFFNDRIKERTDTKAKEDTALKEEVDLIRQLRDSNPKNGNKN